ncbi:hypothetical protein ACJIZ3_007423 [Penstemon smallii]|uniref:Uncharacterized protein n=1 Tax=Penstemon smallii TaxID=265156 RepID=A0ABD3SB07_9LAMI
MRGAIMKGGYWNMNMNATHGSNRSKRLNIHILKVIILLLFGAALLGLTGMHRAKDRRGFDLLIEEKDAQIFSLQLLLQKEREGVQEEKSKIDGMKIKIYSLRAQKTELNGRISEMESTISSLKDEQRTMELAFQEKQNEVKDQNPQVKALTEMLQQKETEIEDLKHHFQLPATDVPSILPAKTTEQSGGAQKPRYSENGRLAESRGEMTGKEQFERTENSQETHVENGITAYDPQNGVRSDTEKSTKNEYEREVIENVGNEEQKPREDNKKLASEENLNSEGSENQEMGVHESGLKLEEQGNNHSGRHRLRGKHGYLKRGKGKRWRGTFKEVEGKKSSESHGGTIARDQRFLESTEEIGNVIEETKPINQAKIQDLSMPNEQGGKKANLNGYSKENTTKNIEDSPPGIEIHDNTKTIDTEDMSRDKAKVEEEEMSQQVEKDILTNSSSEKSDVSFNEMPKYTDESEIGGSSNEGIVQHLEDELSKEEDFISRQHRENKNIDKHDDSSGQIKVAEKNEDRDDIKIEDIEEPGSGTNTSRVSVSRVENVNEVDTEQTDEQEF